MPENGFSKYFPINSKFDFREVISLCGGIYFRETEDLFCWRSYITKNASVSIY